MKTKFYLTVVSCSILFLAHAQNDGIHFENKGDWKDLLSKAKSENKYIFVDCYTTWCGPCRAMDANVYPLKEVGDFFNDKFINVKFQLDTTNKDSEQIKRRYKDAAFIYREYKINAFPSYLFFNPDGELVHMEVGGSAPQEFIAKANKALDPQTQYYTQLKKYKAGNRDAPFLKNLTLLALQANDGPAISKYAKEYYVTQTDLLSKENLEFVYMTTLNASDTGFNLMLQNLGLFEAVVDSQRLHTKLVMIIIQSEFERYNALARSSDEKKWTDFESVLIEKYHAYGEEAYMQFKTAYTLSHNDWKSYSKTVSKYISTKNPSASALNECAWAVFQRCDDKDVLENALTWSKISFTDQAKVEPGYIDTYANLLYKLGRNKEALEWETKAQDIAIKQGADKSWGQDVIDKIKKGEKTW